MAAARTPVNSVTLASWTATAQVQQHKSAVCPQARRGTTTLIKASKTSEQRCLLICCLFSGLASEILCKIMTVLHVTNNNLQSFLCVCVCVCGVCGVCVCVVCVWCVWCVWCVVCVWCVCGVCVVCVMCVVCVCPLSTSFLCLYFSMSLSLFISISLKSSRQVYYWKREKRASKLAQEQTRASHATERVGRASGNTANREGNQTNKSKNKKQQQQQSIARAREPAHIHTFTHIYTHANTQTQTHTNTHEQSWL